MKKIMKKILLKFIVGFFLTLIGFLGLWALLDFKVLVFLLLSFLGFAFMIDSNIEFVEFKELIKK